MKKKLFIWVFSFLLPFISLPLFVSCSTSENQESTINNDNNQDSNKNNNQPDDISNNETEKETKVVEDIVNEVNIKYFVDNNPKKLFFRWSFTSDKSKMPNDIKGIEDKLFPSGNWKSIAGANQNITTYEAKNFNDASLFKSYLSIDTLKNENNSSGKQTALDINDVNFDGITNSSNIMGFFEITETKLSNQIQREISLIIELAEGKKWKSNSENYSIIFTYVQTIFSGS